MKNVIALVMLSLLVGCSTLNTTELNVGKTKVEKVVIPDSLLMECKPGKFMSKEEYLKLQYQEREGVLTDYILDLYAVIAGCNTNITNIRKLNSESKQRDK